MDKCQFTSKYYFGKYYSQNIFLKFDVFKTIFFFCFPIIMLEKTLETPLDSKEIKPVNPKGKQP